MRVEKLIKLVLVVSLTAIHSLVFAQWSTSGTTSDIHYKDGKVVIGGIASQESRSVVSDIDVIYNNDGHDMVYNQFGADGEDEPPALLDEQAFLDRRIFRDNVAVHETPVSKIFYSTVIASFNRFTHLTGRRFVLPHGQVINAENGTLEGLEPPDPADVYYDKRYSFASTHDPIQILLDYGEDPENDNGDPGDQGETVDIFWSLRMNDTHDYDYSSVDKRSQWKKDHPNDLLSSTPANADWCGIEPTKGVRNRKTAVNYSKSAVRQQVLAIVQHSLERYTGNTTGGNLKGLELDFSRHSVYFESQMNGLPASQTELNLMTSLVEDIADLCNQYGINLAISVLDNLALNKEIGLDVESWLSDPNIGIDIITQGGYWHVQPWLTTVNEIEAINSDVKIYANISLGNNSRFGGLTSQMLYVRGEIIDAVESGVDGIYFFNKFNPKYFKDVFKNATPGNNTLSNLKSLPYIHENLIQPPNNQAILDGWVRCGYSRYVNHEESQLVTVEGNANIEQEINIDGAVPRVYVSSLEVGAMNFRISKDKNALEFQLLDGNLLDYKNGYTPFAIQDLSEIDENSAVINTTIEIKGASAGEAELNVDGSTTIDDKINITGDIKMQDDNPSILFDNQKVGGYLPFKIVHVGDALQFQQLDASFNYVSSPIRIYDNGNVTFSGGEDFRLNINGSLNAPGVGADDVFYDDYELRSLKEVSQFIKENKHLPGVPPAVETEKGIDMAEFDEILLRKIEELTLYIIEKEKRIKELERKVQGLKN